MQAELLLDIAWTCGLHLKDLASLAAADTFFSAQSAPWLWTIGEDEYEHRDRIRLENEREARILRNWDRALGGHEYTSSNDSESS